MVRAAYEHKPVTPAVAGACVAGLFGSAVGVLMLALIPTTGWLTAAASTIPVSGLDLLHMAWNNLQAEHPVWMVGSDLRADIVTRLLAVLSSTTIGAAGAFRIIYHATPLADRREHYDGGRLLKGKSATAAAARALSQRITTGERPISLSAAIPYPRLWRVLNLLIVGAIGSGKTRIILYLIEQLVGQVQASQKQHHALLIHDTTGEILNGLPLADSAFAALHPHRAGGYGWAMGRDLLTVEDMEEAADQAVHGTGEAIWGQGASSVAAGCMLIAQAAQGQQWGAADLYRAALLPPIEMKKWFERLYPPAALLLEFDGDGELSRTSTSFLLTFRASVLRTLRPLAEAWGDLPTGRLFSFKDWVSGAENQPRVVVIQRSGRQGAMSALWIGMVFDAIVNHLGDPSLPTSQSRTRSLVVDELPAIGHLRKLSKLLDIGRNHGVHFVGAVQDLDQVERVYPDDFRSILRRFRLKIYCAQTPGADLEELASNAIGTRRVLDRTSQTSVSTGTAGRSTQVGEERRIDTVPIVAPDHLANGLGVRGGIVRAVLVGLPDVVELTWPMRTWPKRR